VTSEHHLREAAERIFGLEHLRPEQLRAMTALADGRDVLAVMPTGWGKSAIFQVPALLDERPCVIVSPLIALQQDQIAALCDAGAPGAVAVDSRQGGATAERNWEKIERGDVRYVYLGPEQFAKDDVLARLETIGPSFVAVDEAHCVSAWGHDFRPDYLRVGDGLQRLHRPPVVALTATASPAVRQEIVAHLGLRDPIVVAGGFDRPNISLEVRHHHDADDKRAAALKTIADLEAPGLVYCQTRRDTESYAEALVDRGVGAVAYHAGLRRAARDDVHRRFHDGEISVVVATTAFGMGIDKPDVRFVVHASVPDSIDSYYQQIGRAGRDGDPARAVMFYRAEDLSRTRRFATHHADEDLLQRVHSALDDGTPKRLKRLRAELGGGRSITQAVNLLVQSGSVIAGGNGYVGTSGSVAEAVERARDVAKGAERVDLTRIEMMRAYAEGGDCRRQRLLGYFGDHLPHGCGNCDRCWEEDRGAAQDIQPAVAVDTVVEHREWGRGVVLDGDANRLVVLFDDYGYRAMDLDVVRANGLLEIR
jgi:ATP-dependent DNA helicase RecQ